MAAKQHEPVTVTSSNRRNDDDAVEGTFVDVVDGEHAGRRGVFLEAVAHSKKDGYPEKILIKTRDASGELLHVLYKDVRPVDPEYHGGR